MVNKQRGRRSRLFWPFSGFILMLCLLLFRPSHFEWQKRISVLGISRAQQVVKRCRGELQVKKHVFLYVSSNPSVNLMRNTWRFTEDGWMEGLAAAEMLRQSKQS